MAKQEKVVKVQIGQAANQTIAEMGDKSTLTELVAVVNALVVAGGGKAHDGNARWHVKKALGTMEAVGLVKITQPTELFVERVAVKAKK